MNLVSPGSILFNDSFIEIFTLINFIFSCQGKPVDEVGQFRPVNAGNSQTFYVSDFTQYFGKSVEYRDFPDNYIRWFTTSPNLLVRYTV